MVRTRHAADADDEEQGTFLSLNSRRSRFSRQLVPNDEDSDDSGVIQFNSEHGGPLRRSTHRTSAKRVSYVEDYIDDYDQPVRRTRRSRNPLNDDEEEGYNSKVQLDGTLVDVVSGDDEKFTPTSRRTRGKSSVKKPVIEDDDDDEETAYPSTRRTRRSTETTHTSPSQSKQVKIEQLSELEESGIRRSSRTKKFVYDSFHTGDMMNKDYDQTGEPRAKRRRPDPENAANVDADEEEEEEDEDGNFVDMYSRVKRKRACVKRHMYGHADQDEEGIHNEDEEEEEEDEEEEDQDDNEVEDKDEPIQSRRSYYLRENKPRTNFYNVIPEPRQRRNRFFNVDDVREPPRTHRRAPIYMSPARKHNIRSTRRKTAFHGGSSSTSSSSDSSSDEERFQKRKAKSMKKARQRCLPMNFEPDALATSAVLRDRQKIGSSLADVDPMNIDRSITFQSVGGLGKHIRALKEMVVFPLLYPEIFERFKISPPRGVLFYGPPGTGKTLVARALANECSKDDRRVAFYMRKGADCLSKWVGESERQLRLLFDQAYQTRPSIIFFDEIDGLAPVRSSRQDQIHSSIVSTLLALMDGLDSRGEIVVIGATNRIDSIDPALRRPGRFDREFLFPLPSLQARSQILKIHTKEWNPALSEKFVTEVAEKCIGYCGADMRALCTEAALLALRRRYPQIYTSTEKLQIDVSSIHIGSRDFYHGMQNIVPTSQRSSASPARALSRQIQSLLQAQLENVLSVLNEIFPAVLSQLANLDTEDSKKKDEDLQEVYSDDDSNDVSIYEQKSKGRRKNSNIPQHQGKFFDFINYATKQPSTNRPRLMLSGTGDQGQSSHLAPAIIHHLEQLPVHVLDLPSLFAVSARTPEESCAQIFREARRTSPCIIYLPHINQWWNVVGETLKTTLLTLIQDLDPSSPLLLLATSEEEYAEIDYSIQDLFDEYSGEVIPMRNPNEEERKVFFSDLILHQTTIPPPMVKSKENHQLEELPKAPPPEPRKLTEPELKKLHEHEEATLTELRIFLRDVLNKLGRDRKFWIFAKPVEIEDVPDYYDIISNPMDLSTMMSKIDLHHYQTVKEFMVDINLICSNALEYNPDRDAQSRVIRHRACALRDTTNAIIKVELDKEFEKMCQGIADSRSKRGVESTTTAPSYYHTRPLNQGPMHPLAVTRKTTPTSQQQQEIDRNLRLSRRVRGGITEDGPSLEEVEKRARAMRSIIRNSPKKENENTPQDQVKVNRSQGASSSGAKKSQESKITDSQGKSSKSKTSSTNKKSVKKSIWGRSGYKKRRKWNRQRSAKSDVDEEGEMDDPDDNGEEEGEDDVNEEVDDVVDSEEEMEVQEPETDKQTVKSPGNISNRSPRQLDIQEEASTSQELSEKSPRRHSLTSCLNIEVNMKSPKDVQKSPSQRSPRSPRLAERQSHTSEQINHIPSPSSLNIESSPKSHHLESCQKSPRQRQTSGSRSPRSHDNTVHSIEMGHKSPRRKSLDSDKFTVPKVPSNDEGLTNLSATNDKDTPTVGDGVHVIVNGFDSGIGSSDSSGDSNDSAGKLLSAAVTTPQDEKPDKPESPQKCPLSTSKDPQDEEMKENEDEKECPKLRVTRSMLHPKQTESQVEPKPSVLVNIDGLTTLLNTVVTLTDNYTVSRLEKLYSLLAQCIYQHRMDLDKSQLLELMERRLRQYTASISRRMHESNRPAV